MLDLKKQELPHLIRVRQHFPTDCISDIPAAVRQELDKLTLDDKLRDKQIAITAGSRGIANIATIIRSIADYVKAKGGHPFIVPAMGSHGGATAQGQIDVLKGYGITEETMDCPIRSSMETVYLGETENGAPVYFDKNAYESDGIIVCNRVKPHTDFSAPNESGIVKMIAIGLGKKDGCSAMHAHGLAQSIAQSCKVSLQKAPILCGLAIVENSNDQTYLLQGVPVETYIETDAKLQLLARSLVPHLPGSQYDLVVVKEIGKIYSGTGMDTKVIGRIRVRGVEEPESPDIHMLVALRMNEHSYGNALGIGLADITTKGLVSKIDRESMYSNLIPTTYLERGKIPVYFDTEEEAISQAYALANPGPDGRIAIIENTLHVQELLVSAQIVKENPELEVLEDDVPVVYTPDGMLNV